MTHGPLTKIGIAYTETKLKYGSYRLSELIIPQGFLQLDEDVIFKVSASNLTCEYDKDMDAWITVIAENEQPTRETRNSQRI